MIDLHSHILPGIDDGADTLETALEMARSAVADGITAIAATPHVRSDYPTAPEEMEQLVGLVAETLEQESIPLRLLPGGELALESVSELDDNALGRFGLGGNPSYLLIEMPYSGWPLALEETLFRLRLRGFTTVLAHPERNGEVQERPDRLERLVRAGTLIQITAASVDGRLGQRANKTATRLLDLGLAHMLASDAHAPAVRQVGLTAAVESLGDPNLGHWLTAAVPEAILASGRLPARPAPLGRRKRRIGRSFRRP